jgi:uncharacterized protein
MPAGRIKIMVGDISVAAVLGNSDCAQALWEALPVTASANTWGDEIYFGIGINQELDDDARETVELGAVGYWPPGDALCLFFGPTPMSVGDEIRPASAVNILGMIEGDSASLKCIASGATVIVERE